MPKASDEFQKRSEFKGYVLRQGCLLFLAAIPAFSIAATHATKGFSESPTFKNFYSETIKALAP